jgi:hypothetical protein
MSTAAAVTHNPMLGELAAMTTPMMAGPASKSSSSHIESTLKAFFRWSPGALSEAQMTRIVAQRRRHQADHCAKHQEPALRTLTFALCNNCQSREPCGLHSRHGHECQALTVPVDGSGAHLVRHSHRKSPGAADARAPAGCDSVRGQAVLAQGGNEY